MKYFIDTEFLEGTQKKSFLGFRYGQTKPTIDLISIGIVAEDGREYYSVSREFNLREAWNRFDIKIDPTFNHQYQDFWIRDNVLRPIWEELYKKEMNTAPASFKYIRFFSYDSLSYLVEIHGKSNKKIAEEVEVFCNYKNSFGKVLERIETPIEFYGYFADYDWVVFCWLFGKMMKLPSGFPKYCRDLKQMLDDKVNSFRWLYLRDTWSNKNMSIKNIGTGDYQEKDREATFEEKLKRTKELIEFPKQSNEHHALSDARWNRDLYNFLKSI